MKIKKITALSLAAVTAASMLAACGGSKTNSYVESDYDKKLKFTITSNQSDDGAAKNAPYQYMKEKFNVDFELFYVTDADWNEKCRIWMATGDMPDVMQTTIGSNYTTYTSWVEQGLMRELPDLSKWENLQTQQDAIAVTDYYIIDGKRYVWVSGNKYDPERPFGDPSGYGFIYRKDIAKELGLFNENEEYTWEEFLNLARAMRDKYKDDPSFIAWGMDAGLYPYGTGLMMYSPYWEQYKLVDGKYVWAMDLPETLEGIKAANAMFKEGLFSPDQAIFNGSEATDKFKTGKCGILMANCATYNLRDICSQFEATQGKSREEGVSIARVYAPDGKMWGQYGMNYNSVTMFRPDLSDEKMERILDIFDWTLSDEGISMIQYGVEGVDHEVIDGKKTLIDPEGRIEGGNPLFAKNMIVGAPEVPEISEKLNGKYVNDLSKNYIDFLVKHDENFRRYDYKQTFFGGERYKQHGAYFSDGKDLIERLMPGDSETLEAEWNAWKDSVRPNVDAVLAELNAE